MPAGTSGVRQAPSTDLLTCQNLAKSLEKGKQSVRLPGICITFLSQQADFDPKSQCETQ